ncbi:hypothetical protein DUNSADRAFT_14112 [Dunaliella salina]|uniref:peptidylprolyl isomerase n=1 Tax=Dunaliella salina TaxID=3046 RepID=A0ABQ7G801_DUNSA|nr:hypothetical protein DUNSADRAFT_14112 [Dunaliella salina]|eukprot:KAF5830730.1 hypothetical protein DUNSADRAFT_14112 [Dunaliella salina]
MDEPVAQTNAEQQEPSNEETASPSPQAKAPIKEVKEEDLPSTSIAPPEDAIVVTDDRSVLKRIIVEGHGNPPPLFSRCLVHYVGRLQRDGSIFMDTRTESQSQQPVKVVSGRHSSAKETGLWLAVATMRVGEKAIVFIQDPKYGYGAAGNFSFPAVPPSSSLTYEVEMVGFEEPQQPDESADDASGLLFEERLERAEQRRVQGNQLFTEGRYQEALSKYAVALSYMDEDFMIQLEGFYEDKAKQVKLPIHLNMAMCQLRSKDFQTAIYNCSEVLKIEPGNAKALFRRGTARHALGQTELALPDLQAAAEKSPKDAAIARELAALHNTLRQERKATASLFKGRLPPPTQNQQQGRGVEDRSNLPPEQVAIRVPSSRGSIWSWISRVFGWLQGLLRLGQRQAGRS